MATLEAVWIANLVLVGIRINPRCKVTDKELATKRTA